MSTGPEGNPVRAVVFDGYDTVFDVISAVRRVSAEPGRGAFSRLWPAVARDWRRKELEYTWWRAITGAHADFLSVTQDALDWALEAAGLAEHDLRARLLALYWELEAFPEVPALLDRLRDQGFRLAILSNGTPAMLDAAIDSAGLRGAFDAVLSVETTGLFKPARPVYDLVEGALGIAPDQTYLVSANGWEAASAAGYGFRSVWINRDRLPVERLPWRPARMVSDLAGLAAHLETP